MLLRFYLQRCAIRQAAWRLSSLVAGAGWHAVAPLLRLSAQQLHASRSTSVGIFEPSGTPAAVMAANALNSSARARSRAPRR